jgi:membrane protease YdiL (CAAX protease family)
LLIARLGGSLADTFDPGLRRRGVPLTLAVFVVISFALLAVVSPSLKEITAAGVSGPTFLPWVAASWLWISIEAGLCEEYLFRAGLQSRLTAWIGSPLAAILATSVLFGLMHWPGLYLRGGPDVDGWSTDPLQVAAFTVATLSPLAVMVGVLWARTRSLVLVVLVHGAIDALPHTAEMIRAFS